MKKLLSLLFAAILLTFCIVPVVSQAKEGVTLYINSYDDRLPVKAYMTPESKSEVLTKLKHRTQVILLRYVDRKWAEVMMPKTGDIYYVKRVYLSKTRPTTVPAVWNRYDEISEEERASMVPLDEEVQYTMYVKTRPGGKLPLRKGPAKNFSILVKMSRGDEVTVLEEGKHWFYIRHEDTGTEGYAHKDWLMD